MENFEKILLRAAKKCDSYYDEDYFNHYHNGFCEIYPFTTENISGYIDDFDLKDKSLLTVGSSGDQVLNAILKGCRDITLLDINPYTKFYYYLKAASIITLGYDEFMDFFRYKDYPRCFKNNYNTFSKEVYDRVKDILRILDYESSLFWDELFNNFDSIDIRNNLFSSDEGVNSEIIESNLYLINKDNYNILKNNLKRVRPTFINDDIFKGLFAKTFFGRTFDNIWLSNLPSYHSTNETSYLVDALDEVLNDNGSLLISYMYDTKRNSYYYDKWPEIYDLEKTFRTFKKYNPEFINFPGIIGIRKNDESRKDAVLVYKKNR